MAESYLRREPPFRNPGQVAVEDGPEDGAPLRERNVSRGEVSGPSFLGLAGGSSGSGDYLLEDEPRGAWRKWAVLLILILLGVLAYMQWKTNWRAQPATPPPAPMAPSQSGGPQGSAAPASEATGVPGTNPQQAAKQPDPSSQPPAKETAAASSPDKPKSDDAAAKEPPGKGDAAADDHPDKSDEQPAAETQNKPTSHARKPAADRSSTTADPQRDPMVLMAQKYLYGQGVRRDCDQAMVYLKAANQKASVPARSQMGALYATGYCVPLDRVRAYQWFTSALNVEPDNPALQRERNNLWAQMSSAERQQAVK